jgi:hypothetical protein
LTVRVIRRRQSPISLSSVVTLNEPTERLTVALVCRCCSRPFVIAVQGRVTELPDRDAFLNEHGGCLAKALPRAFGGGGID